MRAFWLVHFWQYTITRDLKQKRWYAQLTHWGGHVSHGTLAYSWAHLPPHVRLSSKAWYPDQTSSPLRLCSKKCCSCSNKYLKIAVSKKGGTRHPRRKACLMPIVKSTKCFTKGTISTTAGGGAPSFFLEGSFQGLLQSIVVVNAVVHIGVVFKSVPQIQVT